jgi:hypothetical protein
MKSRAAVLAACVWFLALSGQAVAQTTQRFEANVTVRGHAALGSPSEHFLRFSAPVGIPGVGLAPGTYIFRIVAPSVVQVLSGDRAHAYAMFWVNPISRSKVTDRDEMTLKKIRDDAPVRIAAWYLAGSSTGYEPMYRNNSRLSERMLALK